MVGFSSKKAASQRVAEPSNHIGVELASYGLRADGLLFKKGVKASDANGSRFQTAQKELFKGFQQRDVVGCGVDLLKRTIFFTLNGVYLGVAFKDVDLGLKDHGQRGKASSLIEAIADHRKPNRKKSSHVPSEQAGIAQQSCNLYPAICLQVQGDQVKCNFGKKPFVFDLQDHQEKMRFREQFEVLKRKQVSLESMYGLVRDYLNSMAYTETIRAIESESLGLSDALLSPVDVPQEETKEQSLSISTMARKMTIDFSLPKAEQASGEEVKVKAPDLTSEGSRSQLTVETEQMVPLAGTDFVPKGLLSSSSQQLSQKGQALQEPVNPTQTAAEYVEDLVASCLGPQAYETNIESAAATTDSERQKKSYVAFSAGLSAAGDDGQALQSRLQVLSRSKSTSVSRHYLDGLLPETQDSLDSTNRRHLADRGNLRKLLKSGQYELASQQLFNAESPLVKRDSARGCTAELYLIALRFIKHVIDKDVPSAVQLLKHASFKKAGAVIPVWDTKRSTHQMRPVHSLASLLCYSDALEQTKNSEVGDLLNAQTRNALINSIILATDKQHSTSKMAQMMRQLQVTQEMLLESRQN